MNQLGTPNDRPAVHSAAENAFASFMYRWRWAFAAATVIFVAVAFGLGISRVGGFSASVAGLADTSIGDGAVKPLAFDPSMDIWFGQEDSAVRTYYDIENTFVAEDFVMVTFEVPEANELGVFDRDSLATISRLTERFLTIPGVRHVRSLTYNPWIRWGEITDELGTEEGLIISDLVEVDPQTLTDDEIVERMIATLGAERTAARIGEDRVRAVIGPDAVFAHYIGEPLLLGTILNETGTVSAIQVQVLRPRIDRERLATNFPDEATRRVAANLSSIEQQRMAVRGIEHFLRVERGTAVETPEFARLDTWIDSLPAGEQQNALRLQLADPTKNLMPGPDGQLLRKFYEFAREGDGYVDRSVPGDVIEAPADFAPQELSPYDYHLAGVPLFERNFEEVGLADAKYVPLMFVVISVGLFFVFRNGSGVVIPLAVVFGSIMAMVGSSLAIGNLLNNLTMMAPNMLTAVGIADAIHLVAAWMILRHRYDDKQTLITEVIRRNAMPVFLTSLTTAVGFYSLTVSQLVPVKMLGAMAALGTFFAWILSMTLIPAMLSLVPHKKISQRKASAIARFFSEERSERIIGAIVRQRVAIVSVAAVVMLVGVFGISRIKIDSDFRGMFPDDNPTMTDFGWIEKRMGGVGDLELLFTGVAPADVSALTLESETRLSDLALRGIGATESPTDFVPLSEAEQAQLAELTTRQASIDAARIGISTEFLAQLDAFEARLREEMADPSSRLAVVTDLVSPLDTLRKIHQVQNENKAAHYRVPREADVAAELRQPILEYDEFTEEWSVTPAQTGANLVAQYYLQYESGARPGESLTTELSADRTQFRVQARVLQASATAHLEAFERIDEIARDEFPLLAASATTLAPGEQQGASAGLSNMTLSGKTMLFARTSDMFARGFVESMALALAAITLLIGFIYRSVWYALASLIPNVVPILVPLSVFGLLGLPLDGPAILVSSVALGVCVDDTIHFLTKFDRGRRAGMTPAAALTHTLTQAGAAMTVTTAVLIVGFSTLLLSDFAPNFQMGALAAMMIGLAWVADFVVTTAVLSFARNTAPASRSSQMDPTRRPSAIA